MPIKSVKMKISKNKKKYFFLMSQGSFNPKIRFLGQKVCPVARGRTDIQTRKWLLWALFQGFRTFPSNLSSRIGDRPNTEDAFSWFQDDFPSTLSSRIGHFLSTCVLPKCTAQRHCSQLFTPCLHMLTTSTVATWISALLCDWVLTVYLVYYTYTVPQFILYIHNFL